MRFLICGQNIHFSAMDTGFCLEILAKALKQQRSKIINSDQGSQFTSNEWVNSLASNDIQISMDDVGRWADNIYIERFWRTIKQEEIYINPSDDLTDLNNQITKFIEFYNYQRPHQSLKYLTPSQGFMATTPEEKRFFDLEKNRKKCYHANLRGGVLEGFFKIFFRGKSLAVFGSGGLK